MKNIVSGVVIAFLITSSCGMNKVDREVENKVVNELKITELDSTQYKAEMKLNTIFDLMKGEKYEDVLIQYYENQNDILVALDNSEKIYTFHNELIIPIIYWQYDSLEAYKRIVEIHEKDKWYIEMVMKMSGDSINAPEYYYHTLSDLAYAYSRSGERSKAVSQSLQLLEKLERIEDRDSLGYANILHNTAAHLSRVKSYSKAQTLLEKAAKIYKELGMEDSDEYRNTKRRLDELKKY
jgi:tetratricopeptide (TPR) repeat protein